MNIIKLLIIGAIFSTGFTLQAWRGQPGEGTTGKEQPAGQAERSEQPSAQPSADDGQDRAGGHQHGWGWGYRWGQGTWGGSGNMNMAWIQDGDGNWRQVPATSPEYYEYLQRIYPQYH